MKRVNLLIASVLCVTLVFSGCSKAADAKSGDLPALNPSDQPAVTSPPQQQAQIIEQILCPLTGLPIEKEEVGLRPVAVMIDNMASARPQSGLMEADIVYEMPAEGGITRYMAIYHHTPSEKIGPVRSARSYFIDKAMEFNAVYVHCGGSPEALEDIKALKVDSFNEIKGENNFWRARDRKSPHNLYTNSKLTREVMQDKNIAGEKWSYSLNFSNEFMDMDGKEMNKMAIDYKHGYKVGYTYDAAAKCYLRTINGVKLKDKETGTEISTVNIIIEKVSTKIIDSVGRLDVDNIGSGKGFLITGGKLIEIEWSKTGRTSKTVYKDLKGNPIQLNKGNTWIQVVPDYAFIEI